ncbi:MAG: hypothetical protein ACP5H9_04560 [Candidatus Woesearchaeota archaeon]
MKSAIKSKIKSKTLCAEKFLIIIVMITLYANFSRAENYVSYEKYHDSFSLLINDFTIEKLSYNAGKTIKGSFQISINSNKTKSPITEAYVYIRVLYSTNQENIAYSNSYLTLHSLGTKIIGPFSLNLQDKKRFDFEFKLPEEAPAGSYVIAVSSKMKDFDIAGHNEIQGLWGKSIEFKVNNNFEDYVLFDVYNIKVNDKKFNFATFTPEFSQEEEININIPIKNFGDKKSVKVHYKLFIYNEEKHNQLKELIAKNEIADKKFIDYFNNVDSKEGNYDFYIKDNYDLEINLGRLEPGLYAIKLYLQDENNFTEELVFRIPINGIDSKILFKKLDHFPIKKDEKVMIGIGFSNPSTNAALMTNPLLTSETYTGNFEEIGTSYRSNAIIEINLTSNSETIFNKKIPVIVTPLYEAIETGFVTEKDITNAELRVAIYDDNGLKDFNVLRYDCSLFPAKNLKVDYEVKNKKSGINLQVRAKDEFCEKKVGSSYLIINDDESIVYADTFTTPISKNFALKPGNYKIIIKVEEKLFEKKFKIEGNTNTMPEEQNNNSSEHRVSESIAWILFNSLTVALIILIISFFVYSKKKKEK